MLEKISIEETRKMWSQSLDEDVLKAATEDIEGYPPEVRNIIIEEANKRRLIEIDGSGKQIVTGKGREVKYEIYEKKPRTFITKIIKSGIVIIGMSAVTAAAIKLLKLNERAAITANGIVILGMLEEIWAKKPLSHFLFKEKGVSSEDKNIVKNKRYKQVTCD